MLQLLVNMIMPQNVPASCCNFTGSDVLLIRISAMFDVDLCVTFLNFQSNPKSNNIVNVITPPNLHVSCSFIRIFPHQKFYLDFYANVLNFHCRSKSSYLVNMIISQNLPLVTLQGCSSHRTLRTVQNWPVRTFKIGHGQVACWR